MSRQIRKRRRAYRSDDIRHESTARKPGMSAPKKLLLLLFLAASAAVGALVIGIMQTLKKPQHEMPAASSPKAPAAAVEIWTPDGRPPASAPLPAAIAPPQAQQASEATPADTAASDTAPPVPQKRKPKPIAAPAAKTPAAAPQETELQPVNRPKPAPSAGEETELQPINRPPKARPQPAEPQTRHTPPAKPAHRNSGGEATDSLF